MVCNVAFIIREPPGEPKIPSSFEPRKINDGDIEESMRFIGWISLPFHLPGRMHLVRPVFWRSHPFHR